MLNARKQASKELRLPATDPRVAALGALILAHNSLQARMAAGASFDVSELLALDRALAEARAANPPPIEPLTVKIVDGTRKTCPFCLSDDLPVAASKCKYCGTDQPSTTAA